MFSSLSGVRVLAEYICPQSRIWRRSRHIRARWAGDYAFTEVCAGTELRLLVAEADDLAVLDDESLLIGTLVEDDGGTILHHVDMDGGAGGLTIVIAVAHRNVAGAARLLLFLEVAVEQARRVQAEADLRDVVGALDLRDLTADLRADLRVAADDLDDAALFNAQLDGDGRAAVVACI